MQSVSHLFMPHQPRLRMEVLGYCRGSQSPYAGVVMRDAVDLEQSAHEYGAKRPIADNNYCRIESCSCIEIGAPAR